MPWEANVIDLGFGKDTIKVYWDGDRVRLFRDQLYMPTHWFSLLEQPRFPIEIEVDAYNSVMESNESNNKVVVNH